MADCTGLFVRMRPRPSSLPQVLCPPECCGHRAPEAHATVSWHAPITVGASLLAKTECQAPQMRLPVPASSSGCGPDQAHSHRFCVQPVTGMLHPKSAKRASLLIFIPQQPRHHKTRLGCRLNAGGAEWVERHGCRESAVRTWMSVRRGPTERRRSEGTSTQSRPNQEPGHLVTWCLFK
jgi:hypothetical protein